MFVARIIGTSTVVGVLVHLLFPAADHASSTFIVLGPSNADSLTEGLRQSAG